MVYHGRVSNGMIVLDGQPSLPEGAAVTVEVAATEPSTEPDDGSLAERLLKLAGSAGPGLPADLARNHDHYLHGLPKR